MVVGFTTTYAISAYHHWCCEFESRLGRGVQHKSLPRPNIPEPESNDFDEVDGMDVETVDSTVQGLYACLFVVCLMVFNNISVIYINI
jgi:hypothetical protein